MPEVYIDSLTVENFGPYYGEHHFNFAPLDDRCGILVGGKNGAGKTHLLRALYLAAVGETGVHDLKKVEPASESTRFLFEKSLNRRAQTEGQDTVRLQVGHPNEMSKVAVAGRRSSSGRFATDRTRRRFGIRMQTDSMVQDVLRTKNIWRSCVMRYCRVTLHVFSSSTLNVDRILT